MPVKNKTWYFCFLLLHVFAYGQHLNLKFENLDTGQGLSSSTCLEIYQDKEGFMWFGTIDGLNRYDGYSFEIYRPSVTDANTISNNRINVITEDNTGRLWIGTSNGLNLFDKKEQKFYKVNLTNGPVGNSKYREIINALSYDKTSNSLYIGSRNGLIALKLDKSSEAIAKHPAFERFEAITGNDTSLDNNSVTSLAQDGNGNIWVLTEGNALNRFRLKDKIIQRYEMATGDQGFFTHLPKRMALVGNNKLWIGNDASKLFIFDLKTLKFQTRSYLKKSMPVFDLYADEKGTVWVATDGGGLYILDENKGVVQHIVHDINDPYSLSNDQPSKILKDKSGIFWIATYNKGINKLALSKSLFGHYYYKAGKPSGLSTKIAQAVLQDSFGNLWIGTDGGGLNLFNEQQKTFTYFKSEAGNPLSLSSNKIVCMMQGEGKTLWIGTWDGGLNKFDIVSKKSKAYTYKADNPHSIGQNTVWCLEKDKNKRIWIGTSTAGLNVMDPTTEKFYSFKHDSHNPKSLINNFVFSLFYDSHGRLLVGTAQGLCYATLPAGSTIPTKLAFTEVPIKNISNNRVNYITEDVHNNIWVGTDVGLYVLSENLTFKKFYSINNGLSNNLIVGIQQDNMHNIWVTSKGGLSLIDISANAIRNFNIHDGLQGVEYQSKSICRTHDGRIMAGGINGFNIFDPKTIHQENTLVTPYINELRLFNKKIDAGDTLNNRIILNRSIGMLPELELRYNEGYVSFGFVALNYKNPDRVKYAYRMVGLDQDLIELDNTRMANYSNLAPGHYEFEVLAAIDGNWERAGKAVLPVVITPPFWKTWWAYCVYTLLLVAFLYYGVKYYTRFVREEKEHELDQMKLQFFINVSHEFRTPLTLILNPVEKIIAHYNDPEQVKNAASIIQRSSSRLLYLVNQLLDFRKMDVGESELDLQKVNIENFIKDVFDLFQGLAKSKDLELTFESTVKNKNAFYDPDKVEKILTNLISNAIKFTGPGGKITVKLEEERRDISPGILSRIRGGQHYSGFLKISVVDTGVGFKKEHYKDIFKRFFHPDSATAGTGIGLNYTKALVELHKGTIEARSLEGSGSVFTVFLPLDLKQHSKKIPQLIHERADYIRDTTPVKSLEYELSIEDAPLAAMTEEPLLKDDVKPLVLIVEDNKELRTHLKNELAENFRVKEASNGAAGLEMVRKYYPDIVISDVMMPQMDGFELCRQIKNDLQTSHIAVILLTARSLEEDQVAGYSTGADQYLCKPFRMNVLKAQITNLLLAKKRVRERFADIGVVSKTESQPSTADEIFIDKATKIVIDNISNAELTLEDIISKMGLGRSQFFRKVNAITGQNPSNFIRTIRLKRAARLLSEQQYPIKQIAFLCGFSSATYFAKTFKELYGLTPREYISNFRKEEKIIE